MATHSSILAWRMPWTEGPGGLLSMGSRLAYLCTVGRYAHTAVCFSWKEVVVSLEGGEGSGGRACPSALSLFCELLSVPRGCPRP